MLVHEIDGVCTSAYSWKTKKKVGILWKQIFQIQISFEIECDARKRPAHLFVLYYVHCYFGENWKSQVYKSKITGAKLTGSQHRCNNCSLIEYLCSYATIPPSKWCRFQVKANALRWLIDCCCEITILFVSFSQNSNSSWNRQQFHDALNSNNCNNITCPSTCTHTHTFHMSMHGAP